MYQFIPFTHLYTVTDVKLSKWFTVNIDPVLEYLYHAAVGCVTNVSEEYVASIFRVGYRKRLCYTGRQTAQH
jgi:hypothetical protein